MEIAEEKLDIGQVAEVESCVDSRASNDTLRIALRAAYWFFVGLMLFCAFFVGFFPYQSMRLYFNLGMRRATFNQASRVINRYYDESLYANVGGAYRSRFADGLFMAASLSGQFLQEEIGNGNFDSRRTRRIAERTFSYNNMMILNQTTPEREAFGEGVFFGLAGQRMREVIDPSRQNSALIAPRYRPHVFSYESAVRENRVRALYVLGDTDGLLVYFLSEISQLRLDIDMGNLSPILMDRAALVFNEMNALINIELDKIGFNWTSGTLNTYVNEQQINPVGQFGMILNTNLTTTSTLNHLQYSLTELVDFITNFNGQGATEQLRRAWWALSLSNLAENVRLVTEIFYFADRTNNQSIRTIREEWVTEYGNVMITGADEITVAVRFREWYQGTEHYRGILWQYIDYVS